jgi:hypothetical protein
LHDSIGFEPNLKKAVPFSGEAFTIPGMPVFPRKLRQADEARFKCRPKLCGALVMGSLDIAYATLGIIIAETP